MDRLSAAGLAEGDGALRVRGGWVVHQMAGSFGTGAAQSPPRVEALAVLASTPELIGSGPRWTRSAPASSAVLVALVESATRASSTTSPAQHTIKPKES
jgi:hypothetical protein